MLTVFVLKPCRRSKHKTQFLSCANLIFPEKLRNTGVRPEKLRNIGVRNS